jgi:DNA-binding NarL/FixJ family response regulator
MSLCAIHLVSPSPVFRQGMKAKLTLLPRFLVTGESPSLREAINAISSASPNIVVLDWELEELLSSVEMDNLKLVSSRPSVLVIGSIDEMAKISEGYARGMTAYVLRESPPQVFLDGICSAERGDFFLDPSLNGRMIVHLLQLQQKVRSVRSSPNKQLTRRESQILQLASEGVSTEEIAHRLYITPRTVINHKSKALRKKGTSRQW